MSLQASHQNFVSSSSLSPWLPVKPFRVYLVVGSDHRVFNHCCTWMRGHTRISHAKFSRMCKLPDLGKKSSSFYKVKRIDHLLALASVDDGVTVNLKPQPRTDDDIGGMYKLDESLQGEDYKTGLVQLLHDAARLFELAIKEQNTLSKTSWFSIAWLGEDKNVWVKALSYQAAVYSLLQAASEISSRGDGRDRDINVFLQKSISRQSAPLETVINDKLLDKQPEACDWFWSEKTPELVTSFVNYLDKEQCLAPANAVHKKGFYKVSGNSSDISLLLLALSCIAAIMKLGPTKVFCTQFFSIVPDISGRLMDMLVEFVPLGQAYNSIKGMGLRREFLIHFGPRAAACRVTNELGAEEILFWVGLVQKQLQRAIDLERIWSRLMTSESIEVLERDLAIFGFFIALGRSTQSYLFANGFETMDEPIDGFIRYLIAGSVLYYPQLSAISSYQLYVEVVCEELDWVLFYPSSGSTSKRTIGHKHNKSPPNTEAIPLVLDVCSHWIESFIKYSKWPENPSNVKAARFLSKGYNKLKTCMEQLGISKDHSAVDTEAQSFDMALDNVEGALLRLEELLQELYVSSTNSRKEYLEAACSDLERIRRLKKETEFLEASFRAKAASLQQEAVSGLRTPVGEQPYSRGKDSKGSDAETDRSSSSHGLWSFFVRQPNKSPTRSALAANDSNDGIVELEITDNKSTDSESDEIQRFELLRSELMELEKRVQRSADRCGYDEEEVLVKVDASIQNDDAKVSGSVPNLKVNKKDNIIGTSLDKLKETSIDVLQGTQLLAIDTAAAMGLLRRVLIGDEVTEKEKQALRRTLTDLASVLPIGFLMLLPVTAVGHAAMLAAIQRYMPALIPSTYGAERLDLLRQLEKVREMEDYMDTDEHLDEE